MCCAGDGQTTAAACEQQSSSASERRAREELDPRRPSSSRAAPTTTTTSRRSRLAPRPLPRRSARWPRPLCLEPCAFFLPRSPTGSATPPLPLTLRISAGRPGSGPAPSTPWRRALQLGMATMRLTVLDAAQHRRASRCCRNGRQALADRFCSSSPARRASRPFPGGSAKGCSAPPSRGSMLPSFTLIELIGAAPSSQHGHHIALGLVRSSGAFSGSSSRASYRLDVALTPSLSLLLLPSFLHAILPSSAPSPSLFDPVFLPSSPRADYHHALRPRPRLDRLALVGRLRPDRLRSLPLQHLQRRRHALGRCVLSSSSTSLSQADSLPSPPPSSPSLNADPNQCVDSALIAPGAADDSGFQGDGLTPTNPECVAYGLNAGFFCGIAGAECTTDDNCDNGVCAGGLWCVAASPFLPKVC